MGGSGGENYLGPVPEDESALPSNREQERLAEMEAEVSARLGEELHYINDRDVDTMRERIDRLTSALREVVDGLLELRFGGSIQRHTYVDGLSDADLLVLLKHPGSEDYSPKQLIKDFLNTLRAQLPTDVRLSAGDLAVTATYPDGMEIQLLPALNAGKGVRIASKGSEEWSSIIHPERFAHRLTEANKEVAGRLVPAMKLLKASLSNLRSSEQLIPYHIETLAIEAFRGCNRELTTKAMIEHFFDHAQTFVRAPIRDASGQSPSVDDYLGPAESPDRQRRADALDRIARRLYKANDRHSADDWLRAIGLESQ